MSATQLEVNACVQPHTTVDGLEAWWRLNEECPDPLDETAPRPKQLRKTRQLSPPVQDEFWRFGLWR